MPWLLAVVVAIVLLTILAGCKPAGKPAPAPPPAPAGETGKGSPIAKADPAMASPERAQVRERLRKLAESPAPADLKPGAMCYGMPAPLETVDYLCPKCGQKTTYAAEGTQAPNGRYAWMVQDVVTCRRMLKEIAVGWMELDESQFCRTCDPKVTEPSLALVVRWPGGAEPRRTAGIASADLTLLSEFLSGSDRHMGPQGEETALKDHLKRIEELLGVEP